MVLQIWRFLSSGYVTKGTQDLARQEVSRVEYGDICEVKGSRLRITRT